VVDSERGEYKAGLKERPTAFTVSREIVSPGYPANSDEFTRGLHHLRTTFEGSSLQYDVHLQDRSWFDTGRDPGDSCELFVASCNALSMSL
jgi:hypothetical protein